jgi:uncharacterized membrane protein HdeD (DUF308 family)
VDEIETLPDEPRLPDWRFAALRGAVALALGLVVLLWPALALESALFGTALVALVYGLVSLVSLPRLADSARWLALVEGLGGIAFAAVVFVWPEAARLGAAWIVAAWAAAIGAAQVAVAVARRDAIADEWLQALSGGALLLFALILAGGRVLGGSAFAALVVANVVGLGLLAAAAVVEIRRRSRRRSNQS